MAAKQIPYGVTDFVDIIQSNLYYVDKTKYIETIEQSPRFLFFIRPRRFGKSLWINTMQAYYDVRYKEKFNEIFGNLYIGKHPTGNQNKYLVLKFNFASVNPMADDLSKSFEAHCNNQFTDFLNRYENLFNSDTKKALFEQPTTASKLEFLSNEASLKELPIYLFIDEYDNFANTVLSTPVTGGKRYEELTHRDGFFRYFFNVVKSSTTKNDSGIKKIFITGVSPITMDDVTSGFNIGYNISIDPKFNSMVGFSKNEIIEMLNYYKSEGLVKGDIDQPLALMEQWYDCYCFSKDCLDEKVFNTDMVLYFMNNYIKTNNPPDIMIDSNIRIDYGKLRHLIVLDKKLNGNFSVIRQVAEQGEISSVINKSFPLEDMNKAENFVSLLFYFGILTIDRVYRGITVLKVPNLTIRQMLFSYIVDSYRDTNVFKIDTDKMRQLFEDMAYSGNWRGVFDFMAEQVKLQTTVRDYLEGEKAVQTLHVAYMNIFNYFILYPEYEMNFGYTDLWMQPNFMNHPEIKYSYIVEFKYVPRSEKPDLEIIRKESEIQLKRYAAEPKVQKTKGDTELQLVYVVYHGWEMIEVGRIV